MNTSSVFFVAGAALKVHSFWLTWSIACLIFLRKMTSLCIILMHFYGIQCNLTSTYSLIYGISSEYHASCTYLIAIIIFYQANQHSNDMKIEYILGEKRKCHPKIFQVDGMEFNLPKWFNFTTVYWSFFIRENVNFWNYFDET